jgi:hypothetical protein
MRDITRIRPFCDRLASVWERVPDWRFGQLMVNALGTMGKDPFFPEDDEMIQYLEKSVGVVKDERGNNS